MGPWSLDEVREAIECNNTDKAWRCWAEAIGFTSPTAEPRRPNEEWTCGKCHREVHKLWERLRQLLVIARLVTLLRPLVTYWRPILRPGSRNGRNVFLQEVELLNGTRALWISGGQKLFLPVVPKSMTPGVRQEYEYCDVCVNRTDDNILNYCFQVSQRLTSDPTTTPQQCTRRLTTLPIDLINDQRDMSVAGYKNAKYHSLKGKHTTSLKLCNIKLDFTSRLMGVNTCTGTC